MQLFLINFEGDNNKIKNNKLQKEITEFFVDYILKNFFNTEGFLKKDKNNKPYIENSPLKISISHSKNLVALLFDEFECGVDVEFIKTRNHKKILEYFNMDNTLSEEEFYQWWTIYEAEYKSQIKDKILSFKYKNYVCTISSRNKEIEKIYEIDFSGKENIEIKNYCVNKFYLPLNIKNTASTIKIKPTK